MHATRTPLALDLLLTADQRRPSAIEKVIDFRKSIAVPDREYDELDLLVEELRAGEFEERASQP